MAKLLLSFPRTFALKKEDLMKIINAAAEEKALNDDLEKLMSRTGLGNRKVPPMIDWAKRSGLVQGKHLTPEGRLILERDAYLQSEQTSWLMHFYLSFSGKGLVNPPKDPSEWGGWSYFIYSFLPEYPSFTEEQLHNRSSLIFDEHKLERLAQLWRMVLRAYTESHALGDCKLIIKKDKEYLTGNSVLPNIYLIGYFLAKLWERDFGDETSVLSESILDQHMGLAGVLGKNSQALQEVLNQLESYGIIEQRRTVPPFQIVRRWDDALVLLEKAYG